MSLFAATLLALFSFTLFLIVHIVIWRLRQPKYRGLIHIALISLLAYLAVSFFWALFFSVQLVTHFWTTAPFYFCLVMFYTHLYIGFLKSVSIRILEELLAQHDNTLRLSEIENIYSFKEMVSPRINLLHEKKWLDKVGETYFCSSKARRIVQINLFFHRVFLLKNTG